MIHQLDDIKHEWKRLGGYGDFSLYLYRWYVPIYDHALNFVGFKRSGDNETDYRTVC